MVGEARRVNRSQLGAALRALRLASGVEAKAVARGAVMSTSKLSKIENGSVAPSVTDVDRILTALRVPAEVKDRYMAVARTESTEATPWRLVRRNGYFRRQQQTRAQGTTMAGLRVFQPTLVPGLLQTPDYMRAVFARYGMEGDEAARSLSVRLERQGVLHEADKRLRFVITEPALRWPVLPSTMMAEQVDRIISVSRLPAVDIRIIPLRTVLADFPGHSFVVRDDRAVVVETIHAELTVTDPRDVEQYVEKFERFSAAALSSDSMRTFLAALRDEYLREQETGPTGPG
jgi:transcriptional regulator with XRE-family HTH domain